MYDDFDPEEGANALLWWCIFLAIVVGMLVGLSTFGHSRPNEKWPQASPERQEFFKKAMRPDYLPGQSPCCGESDAYESDDFETDDAGNLYAILTCNEPDTCQPPDPTKAIPLGTRVLVKPDKLLPPPPIEPANRTGHGILFVAMNAKDVFCYALPAGL